MNLVIRQSGCSEEQDPWISGDAVADVVKDGQILDQKALLGRLVST